MSNTRDFFQNNDVPTDFFCTNWFIGLNEIGENIFSIFSVHPIEPGRNEGIGNYVLGPTSASDFNNLYLLYTDFVNMTVHSLYPALPATVYIV